MFEDFSLLINFINSSITNYEESIEELKKQNNSHIDAYSEEIKSLRKNIKSISEIDIEVLRKIIDESNKSEDEKQYLFDYIKSIKKLLELNKNANTTFEITERQMNELSKIYDILDEINLNQQEYKTTLEEEINLINKEISKLKKIKVSIDNKEYIKDIDTITKAIDNSIEDEIEKERLLITIMKYNNSIYNSKSS